MNDVKRRRINAAVESLHALPDELAQSAVTVIETLVSAWNKTQNRGAKSMLRNLPDPIVRMCVGFGDVDSLLAWTKTCREARAHKHNHMLVASIRHHQEIGDLPLKKDICHHADWLLCNRDLAASAAELFFRSTLNASVEELHLSSEFSDQQDSSTDRLAHQVGTHTLHSPAMAAGAINPFAWVSDSGAVTFQSDANTALEKQVVEALREAMRRLKKAPMRVFREHWLTDLRYRQTGIPTAGKSVARGSVVKPLGVKALFTRLIRA